MTKDFWEGYVPEPVVNQSLTTEATLKLALEALIYASSYCDTYDAITAIKQALAAPVQEQGEPVAYEYGDEIFWHNSPDLNDYIRANGKALVYATPPAAQRQWVGLTDEEAQWIYDNGRTPSGMMEMVEAKLKEKNT